MSESPAHQTKAINHLLARTIMVIEMLDISEMVSKNASVQSSLTSNLCLD